MIILLQVLIIPTYLYEEFQINVCTVCMIRRKYLRTGTDFEHYLSVSINLKLLIIYNLDYVCIIFFKSTSCSLELYIFLQATARIFGALIAPFFFWYLLNVIVGDMYTKLTKEKCMCQL